jgi:hypothetical protein
VAWSNAVESKPPLKATAKRIGGVLGVLGLLVFGTVFELAIAHQALMTSLKQLIDTHGLELAQRIGQGTFE